ncbi:IS1380 family transposase [Romboutsia sp.]|uniref:IS1380 family transposase n=1 Tax=Romboutsia sp. TaxID=1965302 RepID=UPI003F305FD3
MTSILNNNLKFNSNIKFNFDGGDLTSDVGLIAIKEFDNKIGFSETIRKYFNISDDKAVRTHKNYELLIQRIYQYIAGYYTDDNCDDLKIEPLLTKILGKSKLASQPTMCRLKDRLTEENITQLEYINVLLLHRMYSIEEPDHIILDLDSTNLKTYGLQEDANFNYHYQANGYHPLLMFDGITGDLLKSQLRTGSCYTSSNVVEFMQSYLKYHGSNYDHILKVIRGDSGFAVPGLYELAEENNMLYAIRLKANARLYKNASHFSDELLDECKDNLSEYKCVYKEFYYKADKWNKSRRVVVKIEKPQGQITLSHTFIVTNMEASPKEVVKFYSKRGTMENFIKECKNGFFFEHMSSRDFIVNANKLQQVTLAYNIINWLRRLCFPDNIKKMRIDTIRTQLIKVAARVIKSSRNIVLKICSSFPNKHILLNILDNIYELKI